MGFPQVPNTHALAMLLMTGLAQYIISRDKIRLEYSSLANLVILVVGFELFPFVTGLDPIQPLTFF